MGRCPRQHGSWHHAVWVFEQDDDPGQTLIVAIAPDQSLVLGWAAEGGTVGGPHARPTAA